MIETEIHITGDEKILDYCQKNNIKCLTIENLTPGHTVLSKEYITSINKRFENVRDAEYYLTGVEYDMELCGIDVIRGKIEVPYTKSIDPIYLECHYSGRITPVKDNLCHPVSRKIPDNQPYMKTVRCYDSNKFEEFVNDWQNVADIEACVYDSSPVLHDKKWLDAWQAK